MGTQKDELRSVFEDTLTTLDRSLQNHRAGLKFQEIGIISSVGNGIAGIIGLPDLKSEELILFPGNRLGIAFNLDAQEVSAVLLDSTDEIKAGQEVHLTGSVMEVPVGESLLGRVIDPIGRPLDEMGKIEFSGKLPIEREAAGIMDRAPVNIPLQTGIQVIDALVPVGRGQRELILGDRQTGKTAIALDTIINQKDVVCVYCAIGQQSSAVAKVIADLVKYDALKNSIVVVATGEDTPGLNFIAPYAATSMAEYFMEKGRDVLIVYDDLTKHARSYRELSLLLRRPPAREAFPGDIFYIHSRLLERSTHLRKGGSLTALPVIETQAQDISAYIPTNLISITDGQIYLSPKLFDEGIMPAVDVGKSVSRVGGKTQLPSYRSVAGDLRLSYSQFEELETFSRFGTRLDEETRKTLDRGRRVREVLKQRQYDPIPVPEQIAVLLAVTSGIFDDISTEEIEWARKRIREAFRKNLPELYQQIQSGKELETGERQVLIEMCVSALVRNKNGTT